MCIVQHHEIYSLVTQKKIIIIIIEMYAVENNAIFFFFRIGVLFGVFLPSSLEIQHYTTNYKLTILSLIK